MRTGLRAHGCRKVIGAWVRIGITKLKEGDAHFNVSKSYALLALSPPLFLPSRIVSPSISDLRNRIRAASS